MTEENTGYKLAISFPDQSESFTLGYEAGAVGWRLADRERQHTLTGIYHTANTELFKRQAKYWGWALHIEEIPGYEGWTQFTFYREHVPAKPKLMVVK